MATPVMAPSDIQPREVAELLDGMAQRLLDADREMAKILTTARDSMNVLAWNRYAARATAQSARRSFQRRHVALTAMRSGL